MVIIQIQGGLGNQMFQYALGLKFRQMGCTVRYDYAAYERETDPSRRYYLPVFGIDCPQASETELRQVGEGHSLGARIGRRFGGSRGRRYDEDLSAGYQPQILTMDDVYLSGYWQCETYFRDLAEEVRERFGFPELPEGAARSMLQRIRAANAVSVHIRRGDYLTPDNVRVHGGICTAEYYEKAMQKAAELVPDPTFFLFSDDPDWVRSNFTGPEMVVVDCSTAEQAWADMAMMTQCQVNIIANSSFSWWGAWLNRTPERITISPSRWLANYEVRDSICGDWLTIGGGDL